MSFGYKPEYPLPSALGRKRKYTLDAKVFISFEIAATSERAARAAVGRLIDDMQPDDQYLRGFNDWNPNAAVKACTLSLDGDIDLSETEGEYA